MPVDALVFASSSNLGCVGIAAVLSGLIEKDGTLIQDADTFRRNVWECVRGGTVCGNRLIPSITIHARPIDEWDIPAQELMRSIVHYAFKPRPELGRFRT